MNLQEILHNVEVVLMKFLLLFLMHLENLLHSLFKRYNYYNKLLELFNMTRRNLTQKLKVSLRCIEIQIILL